jgi:transcription-repair coupling factor (superfamily II helicase)
LSAWYERPGRSIVHGVPEGYDALVLKRAASAAATRSTGPRAIVHVARDDARLAQLSEAIGFVAPEIDLLGFPAWDCLPYDRVSPNSQLVSRRLDTLTRLASPVVEVGRPRLVITTVAAILQRVPTRKLLGPAVKRLRTGDRLDADELIDFFRRNGYTRSDTVREPGEYAIRGGIIDVYPAGLAEPLRLDLFGDTLEAIREFDPMSQRSTGKRDAVDFKPASEILLDDASIARFRAGYRALFGAEVGDDPLYEAVSAGRKHVGMEHWLPLFHEQLETLFDYVAGAAVSFDAQVDDAITARLEQIDEYYAARRALMDSRDRDTVLYKPLPPDRLYLTEADWRAVLAPLAVGAFTAAPAPDLPGAGGSGRIDEGGRPGHEFAEARVRPDVNLFDAVREHLARAVAGGARIVIAAYSAGSRDRLKGLMRDHGVSEVAQPDGWAEALALPQTTITLAVLGLERGFVADGLVVISEGDILGDRLVRQVKRRRAANFISEVASLDEGDLVVHVDHGIGRYDALVTLAVAGAPHDCLRVLYAGGDKLFVPVENIEVLSRFGSEEAGVQLDKLGGVGWQARKSRVRERIRDIADKLIRIAAEREIKSGQALTPPEGLYEEFCARFPYAETDDQQRAIEETLGDLGTGRPMDRLICGDVGFGKTEVALRAAFIAAMTGVQVAVVVPTTLLARQHFQLFRDRFKGLAARVEQLSRLVPPKRAADIKRALAAGEIDIVIGTHTLLSKSIRFKELGLLVVDEEQHFGVGQKERLKDLKANVHVLTLTATPIPRTLQLALSGVRDMSVIATPPIDRLAVRTFVLPFDPVVVREAILREHFRGGQVFYVCPRIEDLATVAERLRKLVPEVKLATAHGRMAPTQLEDVMTAFCDGRYDVLLSTNIVESGLDIPTANTMVIHRADMFGLAQLYQLRGRIGRSKTRAYAYLTLPPGRVPSVAAQKRLEVMQTLDQLGAGFQLASHDLDIRGAGNLLGEEQSGHIREVGIELYQHMLEEAVQLAKSGAVLEAAQSADQWTPQITIGTPVLIPEGYVGDLTVRLGLYRRIATLIDRTEIDAFAAEMIDRFGPLPPEVGNLLQIIQIKRLCIDAGVEKVEAGPKGAVLAFRLNHFANPPALVDFIHRQSGTVKLRPDHRLVVMRSWERPEARIQGVQRVLQQLAQLAA